MSHSIFRRAVQAAASGLASLVCRHPRKIAVAVLAITVLAALPAKRTLTNLDVQLLNQLPEGLPKAEALREVIRDFGSADLLAVVVQVPEDAGDGAVSEAKAFMDLLADELRKLDVPDAVTGEPAPAIETLDYRANLRQRRFLLEMAQERIYVLLNEQEIGDLKRAFDPAAMRAKLAEQRARYKELPAFSAERARIMEDPLDIAALGEQAVARRLTGRGTRLSSADPDGYFLSPDRSTFLLLAWPVLPAQNLTFAKALIGGACEAVSQAAERLHKLRPGCGLSFECNGRSHRGPSPEKDADAAVRVGFAGGYAMVVENEESLKYDIVSTTISSLGGVLLLFGFAFRQWSVLLFIGAPLLVAIVWTLAIAAAWFGRISILGGAFTCILLGLGIDYAVHIYNGYSNHLREGLSPEDAMRNTIVELTEGLAMAALTTAVAFFGLMLTHFRGLTEFGFLAGVGISVCLAVIMTFLPALLLIYHRPRCSESEFSNIRGFYLPDLARLIRARPAPYAIASMAFLAACIGFLCWNSGPERSLGVRFDAEMSNLRSTRIRAIPLQEKIVQKFSLHFADVKVIVSGETEDEALGRAREVAAAAAGLIAKGDIIDVDSVVPFVPTIEEQRRCVEGLRAMRLGEIADRFEKEAQEVFGKRAEGFANFVKRMRALAASLDSPRYLTLTELSSGPMGRQLRRYFHAPDPAAADTYKIALYLYPYKIRPPDPWYKDLCRDIKADGIAVKATSARMLGLEMRDSLFHDILGITGIVVLLVAVTLLLSFHSLVHSLLAVIPLVFAIVAMLAGTAFLGDVLGVNLSLDFVNIIMFPILVGTSVDCGIYIVLHYFVRSKRDIVEVLSETGRAVVLCLTTTLVGFGSCVLGSYTGLISLGYLSIFGYTFCLLAALVTLPAILEWGFGRRISGEG